MISLGYTIFTVNNVEDTVSFFSEAFGLAKRFVTPEGDYGELATGETTLAFVANELAHDNLDSAGGFSELDAKQPPTAGYITLVTTELEDALAQALARGATIYVPPVEKPWGQTVSYLRDPNGILIELATPVSNEA